MNSPVLDPQNLMEIARSNPEELERIRVREVEQLISRAPAHLKQRLRGLQFQIDCKRRLHKTPLGACIEISKMMFDSVYSLNEALHGRDSEPYANKTQARLLEFPAAKVVSSTSNIQQG